jgi:dUTP pyrophosphatase
MITLKNTEGVAYKTKYSAGFDILSKKSVEILPGKIALVPTGLFIDSWSTISVRDNVTQQYIELRPELQIRPKSGLAYKYYISVLNAPGTIDADYPDEIKVLLINNGTEPFYFNSGDAIAQGVLNYTRRVGLIDVEDVERIGGFGSTYLS